LIIHLENLLVNAKMVFKLNFNQKKFFLKIIVQGFTRQEDGKCLFESTQPPLSSNERCKQCGANAKCIQQKQEEQIIWNCICNSGFTGNGFECREGSFLISKLKYEILENCLDLPQMCSPNAQCLPNGQKSSYLCICNYGYNGDGKICERMVFIYFLG
jgi:hypothetical protein